jgi:hypothetical protein
VIGLLSKLHKWDDSAMFFDGSSLCEIYFLSPQAFTLLTFALESHIYLASRSM